MPVAPDPVVADIRSIRVTAAPVIELFWVLHDLSAGKYHHEHPAFHDRALADRTRAMWTDEGSGTVCFDELLILAASNDLLIAQDLDEVIERLPALARRAPIEHPLATETDLTRTVVYARLDRMRRDGRLRTAYQALLRDAWAAVRDAWEAEGRPAVEHSAAELRARAAEGAEIADLVGPRHWVLDPRFRPMTNQAVARGEVMLVPCYFGGHSLVFDLPGAFVIGVAISTLPRAQQLRQFVQSWATRLKVLADPTRMAMLAYLSDTPSTVTELARAFSIAQPTVSAHVRMLRDAALVQSVQVGSKTRYQVSPDELERLLSKVRTSILGNAESSDPAPTAPPVP